MRCQCCFDQAKQNVFVQNMYTNSGAHVRWNGVLSKSFAVLNGVKQGGIVSPVLFCIYIDGLLQRLKDSNAGCWIGKVFVGALAYADDIVLLAPTPRAMRHMLQICESYGQKFFIQFNANKSACMLVGKRFVSVRHKVQFYIDGQQIPVVDEFLHLGHTVVSQLDDNKEILNKRNELCGKINNVLCYRYLKCCDPVVKVKLLRSYCTTVW